MSDKMRSWEEFERSMRNFEWLGDATPGAMDIDFVVERRGQFLVYEFKPWQNGVRIGFGQHLALKALASLPQFDVYLVGESESALYHYRLGERDPVVSGTRPVWFPPRRFTRMDQETLRNLTRLWWETHGSVPQR